MNNRLDLARLSDAISRRDFLKLGTFGVLLLAGSGWVPGHALRRGNSDSVPSSAPMLMPAASSRFDAHLAATDGHILLPGRGSGDSNAPVYVFGFVRVPVDVRPNELDVYKGNVHFPAPIIGVDQDADAYVTLTNIGLVVRPDLDDSHSIHWHGFPNQNAIFDGVPEVSIAVPVGRGFPYFYRPRRAGTFMYHCHFEDVEHVQMGMQGIVFVRPSQNGMSKEYPIGSGKVYTKFAYNDGDGSTGYDREYALLLNEIWTVPHDNLEAIQETIWPNYKANYWIINGRSYPDTVKPNNDSSLPSQPLSSLIQVNAGDRVLLRFASLGYEQHALQLTGIPMKVVGEDAALLRGPGGADLTYFTNTIYIGPGEARDVLFTAPPFDPSGPVATDSKGRQYNVYWLKNRSYHKQTNGGMPGLGGMVTQVWVYPSNTLASQTHPNETDPEFSSSEPYLNPWII